MFLTGEKHLQVARRRAKMEKKRNIFEETVNNLRKRKELSLFLTMIVITSLFSFILLNFLSLARIRVESRRYRKYVVIFQWSKGGRLLVRFREG
jgi:hypothetical protein